jgi:hypothetical protein
MSPPAKPGAYFIELFGTAIFCGKAGFTQTVRIDHVAGERSGGICGDIELFGLERVNGENVAMRLVALRRACAAPASGAEISAALHCALGQIRAAGRTRIRSQLGDISRDVDDYPVPPAGARRRIRIVHGYGKTLGALGRPAPFERGRFVLAGAAKTIELETLGHHAVGLDFRAGQFETGSVVQGRQAGQGNREKNAAHIGFSLKLGLGAGF